MTSIEQTEQFFHTNPRGNVTILGSRSDICKDLIERFARDSWQVATWHRNGQLPLMPWDAIVVGIGTLEPIGRFMECGDDEWDQAVDSNALLPLRLLRRLWKYRRPGASVCFFSGAGVSQSARTYSAYAASKLMLMKMTELLDDEEPDCKFFILGPGMVRTKIQGQTIRAGERAANHERVVRFMDVGDAAHGTGTPPERIYACLRWCMAQSKAVIGGRNIYVPSDSWDKGIGGGELAEALAGHPALFKLRRLGDGKY